MLCDRLLVGATLQRTEESVTCMECIILDE